MSLRSTLGLLMATTALAAPGYALAQDAASPESGDPETTTVEEIVILGRFIGLAQDRSGPAAPSALAVPGRAADRRRIVDHPSHPAQNARR